MGAFSVVLVEVTGPVLPSSSSRGSVEGGRHFSTRVCCAESIRN